MSEMAKTGLFTVVAILSAVLAFAFQGQVGEISLPEEVGTKVFPDFNDPLAAKSFAVTRFDEGLAQLNEIEIKEVNGVWTLPSHNGYPADAENKIRDAVTPFVDLEIVRVIDGDSESSHSMFGVLEPSAEKSQVGDKGVGTRVAIKDSGGKTLADLIIGSEVKDQQGQRYVRRTGQGRVYVAKISVDDLSVNFEDWIEKDLLNANSFDIDELALKDYSFGVEQPLLGRPRTDYRRRMELTVKEDSSKWQLEKLLESHDQKMVESKLLETEELNEERLDGLRDALTELKIVNVEKKPAGLTADLKTDEGFFSNEEGVGSLMQRGFYPVEIAPDTVEILSTDGEVQARSKDGVEYVLRFGKVQGIDTEGGEGKLNRYLLVSARVNYDKFPKPELEDLPELPEKSDDSEDASSDEGESDAAEDSDTGGCQEEEAVDSDESEENDAESSDDVDASEDAQSEAGDESNTEEAVTEESSDEDNAASADSNEGEVAESNEGSVDSEDEASSSDEGASESGSADEAAANGENSETSEQPSAESTVDDSSATTDTNEESADSEEVDEEDVYAEYERISKENQRKINEREEKIEKAEKKVRELNYRFADWYYVISEDVFKKIHLTRSDIIKLTDEAKESGDGIDAFNKLKEQGLNLEAPLSDE